MRATLYSWERFNRLNVEYYSESYIMIMIILDSGNFIMSWTEYYGIFQHANDKTKKMHREK